MEVPAGVNAGSRVEAVVLACVEVVGAVGRRGVDGAGAGIGGDVGRQDTEDGALEEWMLKGGAFERGAFEAGEFLHGIQVAGFRNGFCQRGGDDVDGRQRIAAALGGGFEGHILKIGMEGDGQGGGQRPGGGGPDDGGDVAAEERRMDRLRRGCKPVTDVNRGAGVVFVLHFGFGQGRAVVNAPIDRLEATVDEALLEEAIKGLENARFVIACHGLVRQFPAAKAADALKLAGLQIDVLLGIGPASIQHLGNGHLKLLVAQFFVDFDLNGQAVAVVAGHVGGIEAGHGLRFNDKVLQTLVQGVTQMDGAVCIRGAVMEQIGRPAAGSLAQPGIEADLSPSL